MVADLLKELSNHNERVEERKGALIELLKIAREDSLAVWDEHFKTILLLLLETLGDKDVSQSIRLLAFLIDACYLNLFYIFCVCGSVSVCVVLVVGLHDILHAIVMCISSAKTVLCLDVNLHHLLSDGAAFNTQSRRSHAVHLRFWAWIA